MRTVVTYLDKEKNRTTKEKAWTVMTQIFNDAGNLQRTGYSIGEAQIRETNKADADNTNTLTLCDVENGAMLKLTKPMVKIGRDEMCDIVITKKEAKKKIDKVHAAFELRQGKWYVIDFSKTGVWLNGERIQSSVPRSVAPGDIIDLAQKQKFEVR